MWLRFVKKPRILVNAYPGVGYLPTAQTITSAEIEHKLNIVFGVLGSGKTRITWLTSKRSEVVFGPNMRIITTHEGTSVEPIEMKGLNRGFVKNQISTTIHEIREDVVGCKRQILPASTHRLLVFEQR